MVSSRTLFAALGMALLAFMHPRAGLAADTPKDVIPRDPQPRAHTTGALPPAWRLGGESKGEYEAGTDHSVTFGGQPSGYIKSTGLNLVHSETQGFATVITNQPAQPYQGKTVRFSASVKTDGVQDQVNLFISYYSPTQEAGPWRFPTGPFNRMMDPRNPHGTAKLMGTTDWQPMAVDMDIPADAQTIIFGMTLFGRGTAYINRIDLREVLPDPVPAGPGLNF